MSSPPSGVGATFRSPAGVGLGAGSWFDWLTTSGDKPLALSLPALSLSNGSKGERAEAWNG